MRSNAVLVRDRYEDDLINRADRRRKQAKPVSEAETSAAPAPRRLRLALTVIPTANAVDDEATELAAK